LIAIATIIIFLPAASQASVASDFLVNRQSTYAVPYNAQNILIFDLTLPDPASGGTLQLESINFHNSGTADQTNIVKLMIWEDGPSAGWNNDERSVAILSAAPFFDTAIAGNFQSYAKGDQSQRIFVTIDTSETGTIERTIKFQLLENSVVFTTVADAGPTDEVVSGYERKITSENSLLSVPASPIAGIPEIISSDTIRWHFTDIANNEFGFRLLDGNLKTLVQKEASDLSYLDETGLRPNTEYSGRKIVAFNDRGENPVSVSSVFPSARTASLAPVELPVVPEPESVVEEVVQPAVEIISEPAPSQPTLFENMQIKITDIQKEIGNFIKQLDEFIKQSAATVFGALQGFLQAFF